MTLFQAASSHFDQRLHRAGHLANVYPFAAEILNFYSAIAQFQKSLYAHVAADRSAQAAAESTAPLRERFDAAIVLPHFRAFLHLVERNAPAPLAESARRLTQQDAESWIAQLARYWAAGGVGAAEAEVQPDAEPVSQFFSRAFLQPYAEFLAESIATPVLLKTTFACPLCGGQPYLGVLRREGDGGKRFLVCSFCAQEWDFRRLLCPTCGEGNELKLPIYVAAQFPHIRVEACETCKAFLPTVDLTKDGNAIPIVDDLAALPLTLWAHEHNFVRRDGNLLGT